MNELYRYNQAARNACKDLDLMIACLHDQISKNSEKLDSCEDFNEYTMLSCAQLELSKRGKKLKKMKEDLIAMGF